jgi:hypothetical protein
VRLDCHAIVVESAESIRAAEDERILDELKKLTETK